jgi:hypothetical protein
MPRRGIIRFIQSGKILMCKNQETTMLCKKKKTEKLIQWRNGEPRNGVMEKQKKKLGLGGSQ